MPDYPLPRSWQLLIQALWFQRWPTEAKEWEILVQGAQAQGLLDALAFALNPATPAPPEELARILRSARYAAEARYARAQALLQELGGYVREAGLQAVLFKGLVLAQAYPYPPARFFSDIDILVPGREAEQRLVAVCKAHGYRTDPDIRDGESAQHYPKLFPPQTGPSVEVHHMLGREGGFERAERTAAFWQATRPCASFPDFLELDPVDHYVFLIYHAVQAHILELGLRSFYDFQRYTRTWDEATWRKALQRATDLELLPALRLAWALQAWIEGQPWETYPWGKWLDPPPQEVLSAAQQTMLFEPQTEWHRPWRSKRQPGLRGWLAYLRLTITMDGTLPWYRWPGRIKHLTGRLLRSLMGVMLRGDSASFSRQRLLAWLRNQ